VDPRRPKALANNPDTRRIPHERKPEVHALPGGDRRVMALTRGGSHPRFTGRLRKSRGQASDPHRRAGYPEDAARAPNLEANLPRELAHILHDNGRSTPGEWPSCGSGLARRSPTSNRGEEAEQAQKRDANLELRLHTWRILPITRNI